MSYHANKQAPRLTRPDAPAVPRTEDLSEARRVAERALQAALDKKAIEPVLLDVHSLCSYASYLLVVSGRSDRQVDAIATNIKQALGAECQLRPLGVEGIGTGQWALLDFGDVVVHVFYHPVRDYYDLEGLWADATKEELDVPEEARARPEDAYDSL